MASASAPVGPVAQAEVPRPSSAAARLGRQVAAAVREVPAPAQAAAPLRPGRLGDLS